MKLDVRNDEDWSQARKAKAYLDGAFVNACVMADEEAGAVECYETDAQGRIKRFDEGSAPRLIKKHGVVRIKIEK